MIGRMVDSVIGQFSPTWAVKRMHARRIMRAYAGAEASRITNHSKPKNQSANSELQGPFGADSLRSWARKLVRDNAYAWGVVDTIVASVVENGITALSTLEDEEGGDVEDINWQRDSAWAKWCETCDYNGELTFGEIQRLAQREIVEAGEVLIHFVKTPSNTHNGIARPVPLAIELIEADRLAIEYDTYKLRRGVGSNNRIVRGVEVDDHGRPVAYWIYPNHPNDVSIPVDNEPKRISASDIQHLFRKDRIGQTRGVTWFAPVVSWLRDLGVYQDNEIQASAVAACFTAVIKTDTPIGGLDGGPGEDSTDSNGNQFEWLEPGAVFRLNKGESVETVNPGRPNTGAESWITQMLRGIAVGTGLSYEVVARDYSKTNYSSSRTSQLEDRRRFRCWQNYLVNHLCQPAWEKFCEAAIAAGVDGFPSSFEAASQNNSLPVEWQTPEWEWVDPTAEQQASQDSIDGLQSTYAAELGSRGRNWKTVFYQRAKEERLKRKLGLATLEQQAIETQVEVAEKNNQTDATGEMGESSRLQWKRNQQAIDDVLTNFQSGAYSKARAEVMLSALGLSSANVSKLLDDCGICEGEGELETVDV